jgi:hypothetical protein
MQSINESAISLEIPTEAVSKEGVHEQADQTKEKQWPKGNCY